MQQDLHRFLLFKMFTASAGLSQLICCCTMNLYSATIFVSHILQYKMSPSVEDISSPNSTTICFKWDDLDSFALGIVIKWITQVQHKTELFTLRTFHQLYLCLYGQGRETEDRQSFIEQHVIWSKRFQLEIFVTKQIALHKTWKEPQCEWPPLYPVASLECFMICIVSTFPKTTGKDRTELQCIIVCCGSRYSGWAADCLCTECLGERERTHYFRFIHF
jgi:hypothetical protein